MAQVTSLYAAILAFGFVWLSVRVIRCRRMAHIGLGDGDDVLLRRAVRAHGNFAEYVPFALILLLLAELQHRPAAGLHAVGLLLLVGRLLHAAGIGRLPEWPTGRVIGMGLTFTSLVLGAGLNVFALIA